MWWIIGAVLGTVIVFDSWHDPRKLRIGVTLVFFLNWILFTIIGLIMRTSTDEAITLVWIILGVMAVGSISVLLLGLFNIVNGITMLRREAAVSQTCSR